MLSLKSLLNIGQTTTAGLAFIEPNTSVEGLKLIETLASLNDKFQKPFSQILAKRLVNAISLDQIVLLTAYLLDERFKNDAKRNSALLFRNSEMFAFQMASAVLRRIGYPFDQDQTFLSKLEMMFGVPLTPRSRERAGSDASEDSASSSSSIGRVESNESLSIEDMGSQFPETPISVIELFLPVYQSYVGSMKEEDKKGARDNFAGQFLFSFFTTPLQSLLEKEDSATVARFNGSLKAATSSEKKVTLLADLLQKMDNALVNHKPKQISLETLKEFLRIYQECRNDFEKIALPLEQVKKLSELYNDLANDAETDNIRKAFTNCFRTLEDAKAACLKAIREETEKPQLLDMRALNTIAESLKTALFQFNLVYTKMYFGNMTPLHRLCSQKPTTERDKNIRLERVRLLLSLGADFKATTQANSDGAVRNALANLASGKLSTAPKLITALELAERVGFVEMVTLLKEAEAGKDFKEHVKSRVEVEVSPLVTEPPRPPSTLFLSSPTSSTWVSAKPGQVERNASFTDKDKFIASEQEKTEEESDSCESAGSDDEAIVDNAATIVQNAQPKQFLDDPRIPFQLHKTHPENPAIRAALREKGKMKPR